MAYKIALFNQKGGTGKTTTAFNLGWTLALKDKRVILVDAGLQCHLTQMALVEEEEYENQDKIKAIYKTIFNTNIKTALEPAFQSQPKAIEAVNCITIKEKNGLFLLPGHVGLAEYEAVLGMAQNLSGSIHYLKNLPGAISYLLDKTAEKLNADYIIIDMSPGLGPINQNLLMISDFFLIPVAADFFSTMAIESLANVLPKWHAWSKQASSFNLLKSAVYPFPDITPRFLGTVIQDYYATLGEERTSFQVWSEKVEESVSSKLAPVLASTNMLLSKQTYKNQKIDRGFTLAKVTSPFHFVDLANKIIDLTSYL